MEKDQKYAESMREEFLEICPDGVQLIGMVL